MKPEIHKAMDCLFDELARLQKLNLDGTHSTPATILLYQERLANIIVRECVGIVADAVDRREPASTYVGKIKEHFGVE